MTIEKTDFGVLYTGETVHLFTLYAGKLTLSLTDFGASLVSLVIPQTKQGPLDIVLGYGSLAGYLANKPYLGVTAGRFANRIGGGRFTLGGKEYRLSQNDGAACLHGGRRGFDKRLWQAEAFSDMNGVFVRLSLESQDGDQGFPGNLSAAVTYGLTADGELRAEYEAKVDQPCPVNLTNHAYFNLNGEGNGSILSHEAQIFASRYVEVDSGLIPTGKLPSVRGSPFDFTQPKAIGRDTKDGYDHCFVLDEAEEEMKPAAKVCEENSGICMELRTTQKGVQFYTGNFLDGIQGKPGSVYGKHSGFCLETEGFPDSPNHSDFPQDIYGPGRDYKEKAVFKFTF